MLTETQAITARQRICSLLIELTDHNIDPLDQTCEICALLETLIAQLCMHPVLHFGWHNAPFHQGGAHIKGCESFKELITPE